ncbi:MAG TPA: hypothetical protein GX745_06480 [Clostridiales bacterium]|nr:hypothetical protein [Clostridiales bacterium]
MRKKILIIFTALIMMFGAVLGCSPKYPEFDVKEKPDDKYAVTSNGGMVVQKGDFIYFINGYKSIEDTDGKNNKWGKVEKGAIYYAKLTDGKDIEVNDYYGKYTTYDNNSNEFDDEFSGFVTQEKTYLDKDDEEQTKQQIEVNPVISKLVTSGGYIYGGIYIIDDYIYYATPTTKKDKKGNIQYELVDFFRTRIDGKNTQYIYTSKSATQKPVYGYYKFNNNVFAVFYEASEQKIYSVEITTKKVKNPEVLAENVTGAVLPQKEVYYKGISQDMPEDFIYYTRDIDIKTDKETAGNIVERVRPNGSQRLKILSGMTVTLDKVSQGHLLYFVDNYQNSTDRYYFAKDYIDFDIEEENDKNANVIFSEPMENFPTDVYGIVRSSDFLAIATKGSSTVLYVSGEVSAEDFYNQKTKVLYADANNAYFVIDNTNEENPILATAKLYYINYFDKQSQELSQENIKVDFLNIDIAAGYAFYVSTQNQIVQTIPKNDKEDITVLADAQNYLRLQNLNSATKTEWDLGWLDEIDYPDLDEE